MVDKIIFPTWANEAYFNPAQMESLKKYLRNQIVEKEPEFFWTKDFRSDPVEVSRASDPSQYARLLEDRVESEVKAFFAPFTKVKQRKREITSIALLFTVLFGSWIGLALV